MTTMTTINISPSIKAALIKSVECSIDMLNDMAIDPMWLNPVMVRELATKSDDVIRETISKNGKEADANIEQLVNLEILLVSLKAEV